MKLRPMGIAPGKEKKPYMRKASDYDDDLYDGVQLRSTKAGAPVIIMHCKRDDPLRWKVVYGYSSIFFRSFAEAVEFCNSRGMKIIKEQMK